jgi:A/G-specific adenine glycosylase
VRARRASRSPVAPATLAPALVGWFTHHRRPLPWRRDRDPYHVWVSEVLLQQTRVAQAVPYYERFLATFPTVESLAAAPLERVLKVWEGAGYYARARHLHAAARVVVRELGGRVPAAVIDLEQLPGIGAYIARSVAALAFDVRTVPLEANGLRVAARWSREEGDLRASAVRRRLEGVLKAALGSAPPGVFHEAVMELGETICRPVLPRCAICPVARDCRAHRELADPGTVPRPRRRSVRPHVRAAVVALTDGRHRWLVQRRAPSGLLGGLWEFPGGKIEDDERPVEAAERELREETGGRSTGLESVGVVRHAYSHFTVDLHLFQGRARRPLPRAGAGRRWVTASELLRLPIPKATEKALDRLLDSGPGRVSRGSGSRPGRSGVSRPRGDRPRSFPAPGRGTVS